MPAFHNQLVTLWIISYKKFPFLLSLLLPLLFPLSISLSPPLYFDGGGSLFSHSSLGFLAGKGLSHYVCTLAQKPS